MKKEIIKILESYFDNYVGLKENHRAIDLNYLPEIAKEIKSALNPTSGSKREPEGKTKRNCDWCGVEYFADNRNLKRGWGKCCSKSCAAKKREKNNGHQYANRQRLSDYDPSDSEYWDSKEF